MLSSVTNNLSNYDFKIPSIEFKASLSQNLSLSFGSIVVQYNIIVERAFTLWISINGSFLISLTTLTNKLWKIFEFFNPARETNSVNALSSISEESSNS